MTPTEVRLPAVAADDLFTASTTAVETLNALPAKVNPLDELQHDARLASQMALSALPMSSVATD